MSISFKDIVHFIEISKTLNISRAADRLGITQPTLSSNIQKLERYFGVDLLVRSKKGVQFTKAGSCLVEHSKDLLDNLNSLKHKIKSSEVVVEGRFSIGCHSSVALNNLGKFIPDLMKKFPNLIFDFKHDLSRIIYEEVISYQLDFGLVINASFHHELTMHEINVEKVALCVRKDLYTEPFDFEDKILFADPNLIQTDKIISDLKKRKFKLENISTSDDLEVIAKLVTEGCGVGILPRSVISRHCKDIVFLDKGFPTYKDKLYLIYRQNFNKTKAREAIIDTIKSKLDSSNIIPV